MKTSIKTLAAAIVLTAVTAGPALAMIPQGELNRDIRSSIGTDSNVSAFVKGDTVTLTGYFGDSGDKHRAIQAAKNVAGVEHVISHAFATN